MHLVEANNDPSDHWASLANVQHTHTHTHTHTRARARASVRSGNEDSLRGGGGLEFRREEAEGKRQKQSGKMGRIGSDRLASLEIQLLRQGPRERQCAESKPCNAASGEVVG